MAEMWHQKSARIERERKEKERSKKSRARHRKVQRVRHPVKTALRGWGF